MNISHMDSNLTLSPKTQVIYKSSGGSSYLMEALKFISENRNYQLQIQQDYYRSLLEAGDNTALVLEASNGLIDGIKKIIDKFIAMIKKIFTKFITQFNSIIKSDKYLLKNEAKLKEFSSDNEFEMDIYKYTHIQDDWFPNLTAYNVYKTNDISKATYVDTDAVKYTENIYNNFKDGLDDWYDRFRGVVLSNEDPSQTSIQNTVTSYTSTEFSTELHKKFRNDETSKTNTKITITEVLNSLSRFKSYDKTIEHITKMKTNLEKEYKEIKNDIKNITGLFFTTDDTGITTFDFTEVNGSKGKAPLSFTGTDNMDQSVKNNFENEYMDAEKKKKIDANIASFIKAKTDQIDQMSKIHSMAFTAKLDACKEAYMQDKTLLYRALKQINKTYDFSSKK